MSFALALGFESFEPDELIPLGLPADDVARKALLKAAREAYEEGGEEALERVIRDNLGEHADDVLKHMGLLDNTAEAVARFASPEAAMSHFQKHADEFGFSTLDEYLSAAGKFKASANVPGSNVLTKVRANGDLVLYNPITNEFAVIASDGTMRTYFLPDPAVHGYESNLAYFNAQ